MRRYDNQGALRAEKTLWAAGVEGEPMTNSTLLLTLARTKAKELVGQKKGK